MRRRADGELTQDSRRGTAHRRRRGAVSAYHPASSTIEMPSQQSRLSGSTPQPDVDPIEKRLKVELALKLNELIDQHGLSQTQTTRLIRMTPPKASRIRRYKLRNIPLARRMQALVLPDQRVEIVVQPLRQKQTPGITVAT